MEVTTARCVVRPLEERDYAAFAAGYETSGPARNRFDEGRLDTGFMTTDWYAAMLARRRREAEDDFCYMFHVFHRETGQAIGYGNVRTLYRGEIQCGEIGSDVMPVGDENRHECAQVQQNSKDQNTVPFDAEKVLQQRQMAGTRDRQELCQTLYQSENDCFHICKCFQIMPPVQPSDA